MKKTNKGFSMVELIIVIAIMAILAGALAPALIKYINKSRISTDIQTGQTIATAIQTAVSNEQGYDCASALASGQQEVNSTYTSAGANGNVFKKSVASTVGGTSEPKTKSKKCMAGQATSDANKHFYFTVDPAKNTVFVYTGGGKHEVYPTADDCLTNDEVTSCSGNH